MIDVSLINENISRCRQRLLEKKSTVIDRIFILENFFTQSLLDKLMLHISNSNEWQKVDLQEHNKRASLLWEKDSVFEETFMIIESFTPYLNQLFSKCFQLTGMQIWKDLPGYYIPKHVDNEKVGYALQIYLTTGVTNLGTKFYFENTVVEVPYKINTGYVTDQGQNILHAISHTVPPGHVRHSVYAVWA